MGPARVGFACPCNRSVQMKQVIPLGHCIVERGGRYFQQYEIPIKECLILLLKPNNVLDRRKLIGFAHVKPAIVEITRHGNLKHYTSEELEKSRRTENFGKKCGVCGREDPVMPLCSSIKAKNRRKQTSYTRKE
ncbi:hypothetical protein CRYUN_Cryun01aG0147500 [Craigia yunnanensis]